MFATMGTTYEEISGPGGMQDLSILAFTDEMFHQCSLSSTCVYVVKDTRKNEYKMYDNENDIPAERKALRIWKKAQGECSFYMKINLIPRSVGTGGTAGAPLILC